MKVSDFHFHLPDHLIARHPLSERTASRLLHLAGGTGEVAHRHFTDIESLLNPGDLLVFNNTKVVPARLFGQKASGGKVEMLMERLVDDQTCLAHVKSSRSPKPGALLSMEGDLEVEVLGRRDALFELKLVSGASGWLEALEAHGHMPLPPYIDRADDDDDRDRYQTVYAEEKGAVAAPTAGLHFDQPLLDRLKAKGVDLAFVTLHVGAGTFQPVKVDSVTDHQMHSEWLQVPESTVTAVKAAKARGNRVVAVGTTSVRSLETASQATGELTTFSGDTEIFIYPGYEFRTVDALITNFHLPESTLIMLVSAMAGQTAVMQAYEQAVQEEYRFFSYGDAMFIDSVNTQDD